MRTERSLEATVKRVMAGVDGSDRAAAASEWAAHLATSIDGELLLASAWETQPDHERPQDEGRRAVQASLDGPWSERARSAGARPATLVIDGPPDALVAAAEGFGTDLLVIGGNASRRSAALHLRSVAHHLARTTTVPLAIVPERTAHIRPAKIVVGVDGGSDGAAALRWCGDLAESTGASLTAVVGYEPFLEWVSERDPKSWRRGIERHLAEWTDPVRSRGVSVGTLIVQDIHPMAALSNAAREGKATLLVVGQHGSGDYTGKHLGGMAVQLVHEVGLPVVVVPATNLVDQQTASG